jgi:hypothetical protein
MSSAQFIKLCSSGKLEEAIKFLEENPNIDISAENDVAFVCACQYGHLEVAKWLYSVIPDLYPYIGMYIVGDAGNWDVYSEEFVRERKKFEVAEWIVSLNPEKYFLERMNKDGDYEISKKPEYRSEKCPCCKQYIK